MKTIPWRALLVPSALLVSGTLSVAQTTAAVEEKPSSGGTEGATPFPACAKALDNTGGPGCIYASSAPELGKLYPMSSNLFVSPAGNVGIGTTLPAARLDILGTARFTDDVRFRDDADTLIFPVVSSSSNSPMILMFEAGSTNPDRMVLGHSPGVPGWGLEYEDASDRFVFQTGPGGPVLVIDMPNGDLLLGHDGSSIRFPAASGSNSPMIEMFPTVGNADRMVLAHSPSFADWGLEYEDTGDRFVFQQDAVTPVLTVDLPNKDLELHDGTLFIDNSGLFPSLDVEATHSGIVQVVVFFRSSNAASNQDVLQIDVPSASSTSSQYIECAASDTDFRVDRDGEIFSDVGITVPADYAEMIRVTSGADSVEPGDVLVIDPSSARGVRRSGEAYSTLVAGVYSTKPGVVGSEREWDEPASEDSPESLAGEPIALKRADMARLYGEVPMAVVGIVPAKVSAENGAIRPGELLVTSSTPGHAMRGDDPPVGSVVGKALETLAGGTGKIRILVTLQ